MGWNGTVNTRDSMIICGMIECILIVVTSDHRRVCFSASMLSSDGLPIINY